MSPPVQERTGVPLSLLSGTTRFAPVVQESETPQGADAQRRAPSSRREPGRKTQSSGARLTVREAKGRNDRSGSTSCNGSKIPGPLDPGSGTHGLANADRQADPDGNVGGGATCR